MDYDTAITFGFKKFVNGTFTKDDIKSMLINHERLPLMVENLSRELKGVEKIVVNSNRTQHERRELIKSLITDFSRTFCKAALQQAEAKVKQKTVKPIIE